MSFSKEVRRELCSVAPEEGCDAVAECYGFLMFSNLFRRDGIRIITGNDDIMERVVTLFRLVFAIEAEPRRNGDGGRYVLEINQKPKIERVFATFGLDHNASGVRLNLAILEEECCRTAFLRGAFLSGGSISSPETRYHLELVTPHYVFSSEMTAFLMEMELNPKITRRQSKYVLYFKSSEMIEDFLIKTGAPVSALAVMQAKVLKDVRNKVNRNVNCETANIIKAADAAAVQVRAIKTLAADGRLEKLPREVRLAAEVRLNHPESSLSVLAAASDPPVSRATLSYRLKKIVELAKNGR